MNKKLKTVLLLILMFGLIAVNLLIYINNKYKKSEKIEKTSSLQINEQQENNEYISEKEMNESINKKITNMDEISRAKVYCGEFLSDIEDKKYQEAYDYLNITYKANYFPTIQEFISYLEKKYPQNGIIVKYNSVDKKGEVFVVEATIYADDDTDFKEFDQTFVVREMDANNFSISFSKDMEITEGEIR